MHPLCKLLLFSLACGIPAEKHISILILTNWPEVGLCKIKLLADAGPSQRLRHRLAPIDGA